MDLMICHKGSKLTEMSWHDPLARDQNHSTIHIAVISLICNVWTYIAILIVTHLRYTLV